MVCPRQHVRASKQVSKYNYIIARPKPAGAITTTANDWLCVSLALIRKMSSSPTNHIFTWTERRKVDAHDAITTDDDDD